MIEELLALTLLGSGPVSAPAPVHPGPLHIDRTRGLDKLAAGLGAEIPDRVDILVLGQVLGHVVPGAREDVDHAPRQVTGLEYLVKDVRLTIQMKHSSDLVHVQGEQRILLTRHNNHRVRPGHSCPHQGDKAEEGTGVRASDADHTNWLVNLDNSAWGQETFMILKLEKLYSP